MPDYFLFLFFNWTLAGASGLYLTYQLWAHRHLFVKPSYIVLAFHLVIIQLPSAIWSEHVYRFLPNPWEYLLLVHGFGIIGLFLSSHMGRRSAREIWERITQQDLGARSVDLRWLLLLGSVVGLTVIYYFSVIPLRATGLYNVVVNPEQAMIAREESLKLVSDPMVRYGMSMVSAVFAPLLAGILAVGLRTWESRAVQLVAMLGIAALLLIVSIPGARLPPVELLLVVILVGFYHRGLPIRPVTLLTVAVFLLSVPAVITIAREGQVVTAQRWMWYLTEAMLGRVFELPMKIGTWYVHYAQTGGKVGLMGIARIAKLAGEEPLSLPNIIGLTYQSTELTSIWANTGYLFRYYSYFGVVSLPFSIGGLLALDLALPVLRRLSAGLLLPAVAALAVSSASFVRADYTTALLTNGFAVLILAALALHEAGRVEILLVRGRSREIGAVPAEGE